MLLDAAEQIIATVGAGVSHNGLQWFVYLCLRVQLVMVDEIMHEQKLIYFIYIT